MLLKIVKIGLSRLAVRLHYSFADYECHSLGPLLFSFMIIEVVEVVSTECCKELQNSCTALFSLTCSAGSDFRGGGCNNQTLFYSYLCTKRLIHPLIFGK